MYGTFAGNLAGIAYFLYFQIIGLNFIFLIFRREKTLAKLVLGSVTGSLLLTWLPILFAFFLDFTVSAHVLALAVTLPIPIFALCRNRRLSPPPGPDTGTLAAKEGFPVFLKEHGLFLIILTVFMVFWCYLLHTHSILPGDDGAIYTGQCTYGDMNMHLGFITSIAEQSTFPPDYSIMPGVRLSYPFLSDSISSSLCVIGASLRLAYILPMVFAMAQIFSTVYLFADTLFSSLRKSIFTLLLFFCNGGLGFVYFIDWANQRDYTFSEIFNGFYTTPTNLVEQNIRWVNLIADMFLPQRATLFGYAVLFPALWLLYRAVFENQKGYFPAAALFVSALPMIHTHSFLSAGIISASWLLLWLYREVFPVQKAAEGTAESASDTISKGPRSAASWILGGFVFIMCLLQFWRNKGTLAAETLMLIGGSLFAVAVLFGIYLLLRYLKGQQHKTLLSGWGLYLALILALALPQLLYWTFGHVSEGGFLRGHFNWGNLGDIYPWFYLKNIGAPLLFIVGSILACNRKKVPLFLPVLFIWWLGELIVFTPNTYDNNKLLYVAYLLLCLGAADYGIDLYDKLKGLPGRRLSAGVFLFLCAFSGILTLGREAVSNYQLYNPSQVALAEYIEENIPADSIFLTNTRHNNEIASLTGRNIVCGADTFLYFHGVDTSQRKTDLKLMYEAPLENLDLYEKYDVDYIVISSYEKSSYKIDVTVFQANFKEIYSYGDVILYQVE